MSDEITFKYFSDWKSWAQFAEEPCDCKGPCLVGIYFEDPDMPETICLTDLLSGKYRVYISDYTRGKIERSVFATYPDWTDDQISEHVDTAIDTLSRTPPVPWIQSNYDWPVHHGDFCCYLGEWDQSRLNAEASDGDGMAYLMAIIQEPESLGSLDRLWGEIATGWSEIYVFACLTCGQRIAVDQGF